MLSNEEKIIKRYKLISYNNKLKLTNLLINKKFNKLTVINFAYTKKNKNYWNCKCDCGNYTTAYSTELKNNHKKSCGSCFTKFHPQETSARGIWKNYKNCEWLTFIAYSQMNCHYCNIKPNKTANQFKRWDTKSTLTGNFSYNGIDRIDSNKTYSLNNIVPCCFICNSAKSTRSYLDFINWALILKNNYIEKEKLPINSLICDNLNYDVNKLFLNDIYMKRAINSAWAHYKELNINDFYNLSQKKCLYCNSEPSNSKIIYSRHTQKYKRIKVTFKYNGLDRIDNNLSHTIDNVVPCCKWCNIAKLDLNVIDFKNWIIKLNNNIFNKSLNVTPVENYIENYNNIASSYEIKFPLEERIN